MFILFWKLIYQLGKLISYLAINFYYMVKIFPILERYILARKIYILFKNLIFILETLILIKNLLYFCYEKPK